MNKNNNSVFFITGGGTGGHIYPAIAVINALLKDFNVKKENIYYIGNKKNLEAKIVEENNLKFLSTSVFGMPRKFSFKFLKWVICLFISIIKANYFILKYKPKVVFATGGYVCAPILFAARFLKVPYILHDSDCSPGIVTRAFAKNAKGVNLAFEDAKKYIKKGIIYFYKNPVREAFFKNNKSDARKQFNLKDEFTILIMGGSQGAKSINQASKKLIEHFRENNNVKIIIQTGKKNYEDYIKNMDTLKNVIAKPYFDNMSIPILASDLIISRAGSISISEILASGNPSILIPYPYAASDHQRINAKAIVKQNAALYIEDNKIEDEIINTVDELILNKEKFDELKTNAKNLGKQYIKSAHQLAELVLSSIEETK